MSYLRFFFCGCLRIVVSNTYYIVFLFPVSLECSFLIAPSMFYNVYLIGRCRIFELHEFKDIILVYDYQRRSWSLLFSKRVIRTILDIYVFISSLCDKRNLVIPYYMYILVSIRLIKISTPRVLLSERTLFLYKQSNLQRENQHNNVGHQSNDFANFEKISMCQSWFC
jgi:hypothetical protein